MFTIKIKCGNAAFEGENCGLELARLLEAAARMVDSVEQARRFNGVLVDINGNKVGVISYRP